VAREDYECLEIFVKELELSGGRPCLGVAPLDLKLAGGVWQRIAEFRVKYKYIGLDYNWHADTRPWRVVPVVGRSTSFKSLERALIKISSLLSIEDKKR